MSKVDWIITGVIAFSALISIKRGFVKEALSLVTWIAAIAVSWLFSGRLASILEGSISQPSVRRLAASAILFTTTLIIGGMINYLLGDMIKKIGLSAADRFFGMVFGLARGLIIAVVFTAIAALTPLAEDSWWKESLLIPEFQMVADWSRTLLEPSEELLLKL